MAEVEKTAVSLSGILTAQFTIRWTNKWGGAIVCLLTPVRAFMFNAVYAFIKTMRYLDKLKRIVAMTS